MCTHIILYLSNIKLQMISHDLEGASFYLFIYFIVYGIISFMSILNNV